MKDWEERRYRDGFPDRLQRIQARPGSSLCTACEGKLVDRHFTVGSRHLCWTCALEIAYGIIPHGLPLRQFGGRAGPQDEDANGARSNAMRSLENDA